MIDIGLARDWMAVLLVALRHCEARSNPDLKLVFWIASSFLLANRRFDVVNDAKCVHAIITSSH